MFEFGKVLRDLRIGSGLSQSALGGKLSVSQDTVSMWEKNKSLPDFDSIKRIAVLFEVSADYLLGLDKY